MSKQTADLADNTDFADINYSLCLFVKIPSVYLSKTINQGPSSQRTLIKINSIK